MVGKRPMEVTGPEALRIVVDSDQSMCGRFSAPPAECFAIDVAFGASERPAIMFGQHLRLLPERSDRHDTSFVENLLNAWSDGPDEMIHQECYSCWCSA